MNDQPSKIDHNAADSPEGLLIGGAVQDHPERAKSASPMTYVSADDAPILIIHGTKDPLVPHDQSVRFHRSLTEAGVDTTLVSITGGGHGFGGAEIDRRIRAFLDKHLLGRDAPISREPIPAR
jgi:dipeptidyl aminopeptidase/acylaminoacyl peptidase